MVKMFYLIRFRNKVKVTPHGSVLSFSPAEQEKYMKKNIKPLNMKHWCVD